MKRALLALLVQLAAFYNIHAQNIVPNYSFEQADSCPTGLNNRTYKYSLGCAGWGEATNGTTDYYNACDTAAISIGKPFPITGIPRNIWGYQNANDGNAYTGIAMYVSGFSIYKEYLIRDIPPLEMDTAYKVTVHVSLADSSRYATDAMGVLFTTYGSPNQYAVGTLVETPQIDYTSFGVISDTSYWATLTSVFVADSAYTSIIIGGFKNSGDMIILDYNSLHKATANAAYYYIDNVIVEKAFSTSVNATATSSNLIVYPNPFSERATLLFDNLYDENHVLVLYNAIGQVVRKIESVSNRMVIERDGLPAGFYHYQLRNEKGMVGNGKLVIE